MLSSILVYSNPYKDIDSVVGKKVKSSILDIFPKAFVELINEPTDYMDRQFDLIITIGGDGTILQVTHFSNNTPILGINMGRVGFLSSVEVDNLIDALYSLKAGNYGINQHNLLSGYINNVVYLATNDIVIGKSNMLKTIDLSLYIDDIFVDRYICDGLLVSSALGSTAYNRSLRGPIVAPNTPVFVITPIAPTKSSVGSIVVSDNSIIKVSVNKHTEGVEGIVGFDGTYKSLDLSGSDEVIISQSNQKISLVNLDNSNPFTNLYKKLS